MSAARKKAPEPTVPQHDLLPVLRMLATVSETVSQLAYAAALGTVRAEELAPQARYCGLIATDLRRQIEEIERD